MIYMPGAVLPMPWAEIGLSPARYPGGTFMTTVECILMKRIRFCEAQFIEVLRQDDAATEYKESTK